ncbi:prolyl oligopeptidase family serine peptidase [Streptomyces sp. NBS 14/10]|uniref:alpha/beta hydrolase family protein n=1 Tax=Streptomyces sp. NBS 14/10 TaxID=1945643 RepID=UPI00211B5B7B|nr:prolyl oligopeptidase family serine peptidase [Streptomyces sp. NBS 14/10]KAK1186370.1 prolyl oligopeptidase family serine peptidase [Streptomyces sp. NBS 14/10]
MRAAPDFAKPHLLNNWHLHAGDPDDREQEAELRARSPISRADAIRTPLMVVQGGNDTRVTKAESDQLVKALRARGVDVTYLVRDDEGHGFVNPENTIDAYRAADRFLARHLSPSDGSALAMGGVLGTAGQAAAVKEINFATCQFSDKYLTFTVEQKTLGGRPNYYGATTCATTARGRSGSTTSIRGTGTSPRENARSHSSPFTESSHVRARRQQADGPSHTFRLSRVAASTTTRGRHASPLFLSCHSWSSAGEHV